MSIPKIKMQNDEEIPVLGFGTYFIKVLDTYPSVKYALECGYNMLDTAKWYKNEQEVGRAIKDSKRRREEIFITSKIEANGYLETIQGIEDTLKKLNTNYLDLVLIHWPTEKIKETYKALEDLVDKKVIKSIGISNFDEDLCREFLKTCRIRPQVNQIETHIYFQEKKMNEYLRKENILHESWAPFAEGYMNLLQDKTVEEIAKKYNKTNAQIMLRYWIQKNIIVIPKSTNPEHIKENLDVFNFEVEEEDCKRIEQLDQRKQYSGWPQNMKKETIYER